MTSRSNRVARQTGARILAWPLAIAGFSGLGLFLGLMGDGWRDAAAWTLLSLPLLVSLWCWMRRR